MKYRKFGNSGVNISELGFGCMRFPELCDENNNWYIDQDKVNEMIKYAYEHGVNYFDTAPYYCHSNSEKALGTAVKDFRDKILISTKCPVTDIKEVSDFRKILNMQLERLQTDHIDFYHFWALNKDKYDNYVKKFDLINEALKCKEEGLIRHVSFSFHDKVEVIKYIIDDGKIFDSMLVQYNLLNRDHEEMIKYAHDNGLGVTVMGPVAGGKLACPGEFARKILNTSEGETYELALKFVLANENVSCALSGMQNIDQVRKNIECVSNQTGLTEEELIQINKSLDHLTKLKDLYCTGCKYCINCPKKIEIHKIFNAYIYHHVYGLKDLAYDMYSDYLKSDSGQVSDCIECHLCESKCPQRIKIVEQLKHVDKVLRKE